MRNVLENKFVAVDGKEYKIEIRDGELDLRDEFIICYKDEVIITIKKKNEIQLKNTPLLNGTVFEKVYSMRQDKEKYVYAMQQAIADFNSQIRLNKEATEEFNKYIQEECIKNETIMINDISAKLSEGEIVIPHNEIEKYVKIFKEKFEVLKESGEQHNITVNIDKVIVKKEEDVDMFAKSLAEGLKKIGFNSTSK